MVSTPTTSTGAASATSPAINGPVLRGTHLYHQHGTSKWHWVTDSHGAATPAGHNATTVNPYYGAAPVAVKANGMPYKGGRSAMAAQPALTAAQVYNAIARPAAAAASAASAQGMAARMAAPASKRKAA